MLTSAITKRAHAHTASKKKVGTIRNLVPVRGARQTPRHYRSSADRTAINA
jgi:hypothetical protein